MGGVALVSFDIKHHDQSSRSDGCGGVGVTLKLAHFVAINALIVFFLFMKSIGRLPQPSEKLAEGATWALPGGAAMKSTWIGRHGRSNCLAR